MTNTKPPQRVKKLSLKKSTVKDLEVSGQKGAGIRGGQSGSRGGSSLIERSSGATSGTV